jgi:hypothetical protein
VYGEAKLALIINMRPRRFRPTFAPRRTRAAGRIFSHRMNMKPPDQHDDAHRPTDANSSSSTLPDRYIPWIPLLAVAQVVTTIIIFAAAIAPYAGAEHAVSRMAPASSSASMVVGVTP